LLLSRGLCYNHEMIYDYIFYKSYQLGTRKGKEDEAPISLGLLWVIPILGMNLFALQNVIYYFLKIPRSYHGRGYAYLVGIILFVLCFFYYRNRYKQIVDKYKAIEERRGRSIHPLIVLYGLLILSVVLMFASTSLHSYN